MLFWPGQGGQEACLLEGLESNLGFVQVINYPWESGPTGCSEFLGEQPPFPWRAWLQNLPAFNCPGSGNS